MKEIAGNLKRDMKDLLGESASIVAGFFKQGLCTVRGMTNRWKNFTQDISDAVGALFQPFENALPPRPVPGAGTHGDGHGERRAGAARGHPHDAA